jgi:DDE family transposase
MRLHEPAGEKEPAKYWLSTLPDGTTIAALVDTAKLRWRIERDFQDLKQEIGLDHYEGRGWRGFHHHAALAIAAYGFLVAERSPIPPSALLIQALSIELPRWPKPTARAAPPLRPERHTPNSITTIRHMIAVALARQLRKCPCCLRQSETHRQNIL